MKNKTPRNYNNEPKSTPEMQKITKELPDLPPSELIFTKENLGKDLMNIRKKRQFKSFLRLCKQGKATTAVIVSKALGINQYTIAKWFETPIARKYLHLQASAYIDRIEQSKDWKAQQYLLEKLTLSDTQEQKPSALLGFNVIVKTNSPNTSGNIAEGEEVERLSEQADGHQTVKDTM